MQRGRIVWFDATSGEGMVAGADGELLYLHYTCIEGIATNGFGWPAADDQARLVMIAGAPCEFTVYQNLYSRRVDRLSLRAA